MNKYIKIKSTYFTFILASYIFFILVSTIISICLYFFKNNFMESGVIILGLNSGIITLIAISAIVLFSLALFSSKKISSPVVELQKVAIGISEGNFDIKADESYPGEVGNLGKTLNGLSQKLSQTIESLTKERNLLKQIINGMSDGLISVDVDGTITAINPAFYKLFQLEDLTFESLDEGIKNEILSTLISSSLEKETKSIHFQFEGKEISGQITTRFSDKEGSLGAVCILRDVTENVRLEETRRDFVANVSHELRSPLTAIKGLIIPLQENMVTDQEKIHHFYDIIYNEINRLNSLVNDLFELSRLQANHEEIAMRKVNLAEIILDQKEKYLNIAKAKKITLRTIFHTNDCYALGNIDRIDQMITILIDNALKFTPENGSVDLSIAETLEELEISVFNTGSFIPSNEAFHLFERFYKIDKARTSEGAGLGLSIAYEIITKLGGNIWVTSEKEMGTTFTFSLKKHFDLSKEH